MEKTTVSIEKNQIDMHIEIKVFKGAEPEYGIIFTLKQGEMGVNAFSVFYHYV